MTSTQNKQDNIKRNTQNRGSKSRRESMGPKVLRIGIIQNGKIVEERIIRERVTVTLGTSEHNTFVLPEQDLKQSKFPIFEANGTGPYLLNFTEDMDGRISVKGEIKQLSDLFKNKKVRSKGRMRQIPVNEESRGKIVIGDSVVLFQFVTPPPIQPRPQLPAAVRGSAFANIWSFATACILVFFFAEAGVITWWQTVDWPEKSLEEEWLELQELIAKAPEASFEKKKEKKDEGEGEKDEAEEKEEEKEEEVKVKTVSKSNKKVEAKPQKSSQEIARERAEKRAELAAALTKRGINKIIGALSADGEGAIADVLRGGDAHADQDNLLSQVEGVGVSTGEQDGILKGPAGGKGGGEAADISQVKVAGGDKTVKTKGPGQERKIKVKLRKKKPRASGGTGMLDPKDVAKEVGRRTGALKACYERGLKRNPSLQGKITIRFTIAGSGKVSTARATENELTPGVADCMVRSFKRYRFPPPEGGSVTFEYPFFFTPAG